MSETDDDVSVTSTVESEPRSEYEVERILAEDQLDDGKLYLVRLAGYPVERSTWEPADAFCDKQTLTDWENTKAQIDAGKRLPFDLAAFSRHVDHIERTRAERQRKREAKRRRLGYCGDSADLQGDIPTTLSSRAANSAQTESAPALVSRRPPQVLPPDNFRVRTVADKPPVAVFGSTERAPVAGPFRAKKSSRQEPQRRFNLSTQRKYEKAKSFERPPNFSQLDLRRPSEWSLRPSGTTVLGNHLVSWSKANESIMATSQSDDLFVNPNSTSPEPATDSHHARVEPGELREETQHQSCQAVGSDHSLCGQNTYHNMATSGHHTETTRMSYHSLGRERKIQQRPRLPQRVPKPCHFPIKDRFLNSGEVLIHIFYGREKTEIGSARICGLPPQLKQKLIGMKKRARFDMWFEHLCTLDEYNILCEKSPNNDKHCNGWVEGFDDTEPMIYNLGEHLEEKGLVAICYPDDTTQEIVLAYSPNSSMFGFLGDAKCPGTSYLSIALRAPLAPIGRLETHLRASASKPQPAPLQLALLQQPPQPVPDGHAPPDLDTMFKEHFRITFDELATVPNPKGGKDSGTKRERAFYLMFPLDDRTLQEECRCLITFLKSGGRDLAIYSNRDPEGWTNFIISCQSGVILFHESFALYDTLRDLQKAIQKPFNFWTLSLAKPLEYAKRPINFQRIFPHGGVILLTEEFMLLEPDATVITLAWFNEFARKKHGSWKIMLRPGVLDWLAKLLDYATDEAKAGKLAAMYQLIMKVNTCGPNSDLTEYGVDSIYHDFDNASVISPLSLPNYGFRRETDHPGIPKGLEQVGLNADHLIEFFAGWALVNCHKFRRFVVATTVKSVRRWESWNHLEIYHDAAYFLKTRGIDCSEYWRKLGMTGEPRPGLPSGSGSGSGSSRGQRRQPTPTRTPGTPGTPNRGTRTESSDVTRRGSYWHSDSGSSYPQTYW